jgi:ComF family protein
MTDDEGLPAIAWRSPQPPQPTQTSFRLLVRQLIDTALDAVFPPRCVQCSRLGSPFCTACQAQLERPTSHLTLPALVDVRATALYAGAMRKAIHAFKYEGRYRMAQVLGARLYAELTGCAWPCTLITAVPLHPNRHRTRGYNQSMLLAHELAALARLPFHPAALRRVRDTRPQVGLNYAERQMNVTDAFDAESAIVKGQHILIVDDVCTTGATLNTCAKVLVKAGAARVWGLTLAAAQHLDVL